jgi:multicomponent Na+:H+ antiporter subunit D
MNLAGIPPFSGFLGKLGLLQAGVAQGGVLAWALVAGSLLTSLLTLYAIGRVWNLAFWSTPHDHTPPPTAVLPRLMVGATAALVVLSLGLTVVSGPLYAVTASTATELLHRVPYVQAVFGEEGP